jgi:hypothetical protein
MQTMSSLILSHQTKKRIRVRFTFLEFAAEWSGDLQYIQIEHPFTSIRWNKLLKENPLGEIMEYVLDEAHQQVKTQYISLDPDFGQYYEVTTET